MEIEALGDEPVILKCRTGERSANAAALLCESEFRDVHVLRRGMAQWGMAQGNGAGLPVERRTGLGET